MLKASFKTVNSKKAAFISCAIILIFGLSICSADFARGASLSTLEGVLNVTVHDDFDRNSSSTHYKLVESSTGREITLLFEQAKPGYLYRAKKIQVRGQMVSNNEIRVQDFSVLDHSVDISTESSTTGQPIIGSRNLLVVLVELADASLNPSCTVEKFANDVFVNPYSARSLFLEASFGQLDFVPDTDGDGEPDVVGPVTIPNTTGDYCDWDSIAESTNQALTELGVNLGLYQHTMYVTPHQAGCGNWANVGCDDGCISWVSSFPESHPEICAGPGIMAHELGHNLGMGHSSIDSDNDGSVDLPYGEYGDISSVMARSCIFNNIEHMAQPVTIHKNILGWFPEESESIREISKTDSGTYTLYASEIEPQSSPGIQGLNLEAGPTLSTRAPIGFDSNIDNCGIDSQRFYFGRTSIHRLDNTYFPRTLLLKTLGDGESFTDFASGWKITQVSHGTDWVTVDVTAPVDMDAGLNGNWWAGPTRNGEGVQIEVAQGADNEMVFVATIYSYDPSGNQIFLVGVGSVNGGSAEVELFITEGGVWGEDFDPAQVSTPQWGTGTFISNSCESISMILRPDAIYQDQGYTQLAYDLSRLTTPLIPCTAGVSNQSQ